MRARGDAGCYRTLVIVVVMYGSGGGRSGSQGGELVAPQRARGGRRRGLQEEFGGASQLGIEVEIGRGMEAGDKGDAELVHDALHAVLQAEMYFDLLADGELA